MKKTTKLFSIFGLCSIIFTSCFNPVFYEIRQDVAPEKSTTDGIVTCITRYSVGDQEYLVTNANGTITYKSADYVYKPNKHGWKGISKDFLPFESHRFNYQKFEHEGQQLIKIVADSEYLYLVSTEFKKDTDEGTSNPSKTHIYSAKITSWDENPEWTDITESIARKDEKDLLPYYLGTDDYYRSAFNVFCTNSISKENRKAYIRSGAVKTDFSTEYFELNGTSATSITPTAFDNTEKDINNVTYFNGNYEFFAALAVTTDETNDAQAKNIYYSDGKKLIYFDGTSKQEFLDGENNIPISCLAVTKDALLIGRADYSSSNTAASGGLKKVELNNGVPGKEFTSFSTNAASQLSPSYFVLTLLTVDPSQTELDSTIYASLAFLGSGTSASVNYDNLGLWSYYKERGNWNRE